MNLSKKDIIFSLIVGEASSLFLIFIAKNPYIEELRGLAVLEKLTWYFPLVFPLGFLFGIFLAKVISRLIPLIFQFARFVEVGILNTMIDFGILNLLVWITGITSGWQIAIFNTTSFLCATTNSYFLNRAWTFERKVKSSGKEFLQFLVVSTIGIGINTGIVALGVNFVQPIFDVSGGAWMNIVKALATIVSMVWNFIGYKFFVFTPTPNKDFLK